MIQTANNLEEDIVFTPDGRWLPKSQYEEEEAKAKKDYEELEKQEEKKESEKKRPTYAQDWANYYFACRQQKQMFLMILKDAVDYLVIEQDYCGNGRPPIFLADIIKSLVIKAYHNLSSWATESELRYAKSLGVIDHVYRKSTINKYMKDKRVIKVLHELYKVIALPIASIESQYTIDASGISNYYCNKKWIQVRLDQQQHKTFTKIHFLSGTITNIIGSAAVTQGTKHESPYLKPLVLDAGKRFNIKELSADAGYLSRDNCTVISSIGAKPYILPKCNVTSKAKGSPAWKNMIWLWKKYQHIFAEHYHRRSNSESVFGSFKRRWLDYCRCKLPNTIEAEIISRVCCYNILVLSRAMLSYNIKVRFMDK